MLIRIGSTLHHLLESYVSHNNVIAEIEMLSGEVTWAKWGSAKIEFLDLCGLTSKELQAVHWEVWQDIYTKIVRFSA